MTKASIFKNGVLINDFSSEKFKEVEDWILGVVRNWNNFESEDGVMICLEKVEINNIIEVMVSDGINAADVFGRK